MVSNPDFHFSGRKKNQAIGSTRIEWTGVIEQREDNVGFLMHLISVCLEPWNVLTTQNVMQDPRDDETLVKFLVNLKHRCIAAEIVNRDLREVLKALKSEFASVSLAGNRNIKANAEIVHGKFAFKPKVASATNADSSSSQRKANSNVGPYLEANKSHKASVFEAATPETSESPALRHLLCTDHLVFSSYSRQAILRDINLLTRHLASLEGDTALLKVQQVRLEKQLSSQHRRAIFPMSTSSSARRFRNDAKESGTDADRCKSDAIAATADAKCAQPESSGLLYPQTSTLASSIYVQQDSASPPSSSGVPPVMPSDSAVPAPDEEAQGKRLPSGSLSASRALSSMTAEAPPAIPCSVASPPVPAEPVVPYDVVIRTGSCRLPRLATTLLAVVAAAAACSWCCCGLLLLLVLDGGGAGVVGAGAACCCCYCCLLVLLVLPPLPPPPFYRGILAPCCAAPHQLMRA